MTPSHDALRADVAGWSGRFFYDAERGDIAYIAKKCEDKQCDCEVKTNSDGDQGCSYSIADGLDDHVAESLVRMLNATGPLLDQLAARDAELTELRGNAALMKLSEMLRLGEPVRPDIHNRAVRQLAEARALGLEALDAWRSLTNRAGIPAAVEQEHIARIVEIRARLEGNRE